MLRETFKKIKFSGSENNVTWGPVWGISLTVLIYFFTQILALLLFFIYYYVFHSSTKYFNSWVNNDVIVQFFYVLVVEIQSVSIIFLFLRWKKASLRTIGLIRFRAKDILWSLCGFGIYILIFYALSETISTLVKSFNASQQQNVGFQSASGTTDLILTFISLVILPPIAEEIIFRGFLFSGLRHKMKFIYAVLITSILFALPHLLESEKGGLLWIAGLDTFTLSVVSCFLREHTKSLWPSIMLHSIKNFLAFSVLFLIH